MISWLASDVVEILIKNNIIENRYMPMYQYGFEILLSSILTFIITIVIGLTLNCVPAALLYFVIFLSLRSVCGGYHAKTYIKCNTIYTLVALAVMVAFRFVPIELFGTVHYLIILLSMLITASYAPVGNIYKLPIESNKKFFKYLSITLFAVLAIVSCVL